MGKLISEILRTVGKGKSAFETPISSKPIRKADTTFLSDLEEHLGLTEEGARALLRKVRSGKGTQKDKNKLREVVSFARGRPQGDYPPGEASTTLERELWSRADD